MTIVGMMLLMNVILARAQQPLGLSLLNPTTIASTGGQPVGPIQLNGIATFHAGSRADDGQITLTVAPSGQTSMQFNGYGSVSRTEKQDLISPMMQCSWSGADGVAHAVPTENCRKPLVWFLPAYSFQPFSQFPNASVADLAIGVVGTVPSHHLRVNWSTPGQDPSLLRGRAVDLGIDPATSLPVAMEYRLTADKPNTFQTIDVHYSNYTLVNGIQVPFSIQRYVNGALQLDIRLTGATLSN